MFGFARNGLEATLRNFLMNSASGHILKNSIAVTAVKGTITAMRTAFLILVARLVSIDQFGRIALCFATIEVLRVVCDFGAETYFIRAMAQTSNAAIQREQLRSMRSFRILSAAIGVIAYLAFLIVVFRKHIVASEVAVGALLITALTENFAFTYYQARLEMQRAIAPVVVPAVAFIAYVVAIGTHNGDAIFFGLVTYEAVVSCWLIANVKRSTQGAATMADATDSRLSIRKILKHTWPIAGAATLVTLYTRLDVFAVTEFAGMTALGLYSFAFRLTEPSRYVAASIDSTLYSYLARHSNVQGGHNREGIRKLYVVVTVYSAIFSLGTAFGAGQAIRHFYPKYAPALTALYILCGALFFRCVNGFQGSVQNSLGRYSLVLKFTILNFGLMLIFIYPLISAFGLDGAAITLLLVESANCMVQGYVMNRTFQNYVVGSI